MAAEGADNSFTYDPSINRGKGGESVWATLFHLFLYITFGAAFVFLILSIFLSLSPSWGASLHQVVFPYFFVFLLVIPLPQVTLISVLLVMFPLYILFFSLIGYKSARGGRNSVLDTPVGYFVGVASAVLVIVTLITFIEQAIGTQVGGQGIDQQLQQNPLLGYMSLIYAPFVEELGFRIIPLGILSSYLVYRSAVISRAKNGVESAGSPTASSYLLAILIPGHVRRKYNVPMGYVDWIFVIITSVIFGYAHIFFGAWDWGKFIPVFITGLALAVAFLKFGAYVDIPFHWFFNGFLSLYFLNSSLLGVIGVLTIWIFAVGVVSIIAIIIYVRRYMMRNQSPA